MFKYVLTVEGTVEQIQQLKDKYGLDNRSIAKEQQIGSLVTLSEVSIQGDLKAIGEEVSVTFIHDSEELQTFCWN